MTTKPDYNRVIEEVYAAMEGLSIAEQLGTLEMIKYEIVMNSFVDVEVH